MKLTLNWTDLKNKIKYKYKRVLKKNVLKLNQDILCRALVSIPYKKKSKSVFFLLHLSTFVDLNQILHEA